MLQHIRSAPTLTLPESDGKPMAETDKHRRVMMSLIQTLEHHFRHAPDVYVSGNLLIYYGTPENRRSVAPDVFVIFGVGKKDRRTYSVWEEGATPELIIEVASLGTYRQDFAAKKTIYASILGVKEYYIYAPYEDPRLPFVGYRLVNGEYEEMDFGNERLQSEVLGLELGEHEGELRFYNPSFGEWVEPPAVRFNAAEMALQRERQSRIREEERAQRERKARETAETQIAEERKARETAEAELAEVLATLERMRTRSDA